MLSKLIAGGFDEFNLVVTRDQIGEQVPARVAVAGVVASGGSGDKRAVTFVQVDRDAVQAGVAVVLLAVVVAVYPDVVAQAGFLIQAGVDRVDGVARVDRVAGGDAGAVGVRVGAEGFCGDVLCAVDVAVRGDKPDVVGARQQVGEAVVAVAVRAGGLQQLVADAVIQFDRDVADAGFAGVLDAVGVLVFPDPVAQSLAAIWRQETRFTSSDDPWVAAGYPTAPVVSVVGGFSEEAAAQLEGDRQMRLLRIRREVFEIAVVMDPFADVVGRVINVANANRLGLGASRNLFCFGVAVNANAKPILKLWG